MNKVKDLTVDELKQIIREVIREENYRVIPYYETCPQPIQVGTPYHARTQIICDSSKINKGEISG